MIRRIATVSVVGTLLFATSAAVADEPLPAALSESGPALEAPTPAPVTDVRERPTPALVHVLGGVSAAALAGGLTTGFVAVGASHDLRDSFDAQAADRARTYARVSDALLITGAIGAAATIYLYFTRPEKAVATSFAPTF